MKRKILTLLLVMTLTISAMSGCSKTTPTVEDKSSNEKTTTTSADATADGETAESKNITFPLAEPITMSMFAIANGTNELPDNITFKKVEEMTNVKWEVQSCLGANMTEKQGLLMSSGEYPDVFYKTYLGASDLEKYGKQGILIPLNDLIDQYAPNLKKLIADRGIEDYLKSSDGNIYALPELDSPSLGVTPLWFNQEWLDNLGLEEPKNEDELYKVLKAFKEQDPNGNGVADEIALTSGSDIKINLLLPYFTAIDYGTYCKIENNKLVYVPTSDNFKEFVAFVTKIYSEGIMDKNGFTNTIDQQKAIGASGDVLGAFFDAGAFLTVGRDSDDKYKILTPFVTGTYPTSTGVGVGTFAITDKCKNPEVAIAWADQFYTEGGARLAWLGIEGETYKINDDGTWEWVMGKHGDDVGTIRASSTLQGAALHTSVSSTLWDEGMTDPDEKYLNEERSRITAMGAQPFPNLRISDADAATIATIRADIDTYIDQYIAKVAVGELDLEGSWDEYCKTLDKMGLSQMMSIYSNAFAATTK
jgi:putative aldouronate transport system substrate-binding protein